MSCLFCKMISKEIKVDPVFENNDIIAIKDINPVAPTHILIIPKKHIENLNSCIFEDRQLIGDMFLVAKQLSKENSINIDGYRTVFNCNKNAGQQVMHLHLHLIGGRVMNWPPG